MERRGSIHFDLCESGLLRHTQNLILCSLESWSFLGRCHGIPRRILQGSEAGLNPHSPFTHPRPTRRQRKWNGHDSPELHYPHVRSYFL